jgi:hypothetical protein
MPLLWNFKQKPLGQEVGYTLLPIIFLFMNAIQFLASDIIV